MLVRIRKAIRAEPGLHGHHAPIFGLLCSLLGLCTAREVEVAATVVGTKPRPSQTVEHMYLFTLIRDVISAGTRLALVGPMEASKVSARPTARLPWL